MTDSDLPASVQFYDNLPIIESMLERRFSMRRIWLKLESENKYTGDYTHFCRLAKKEFEGMKWSSNRTRKTNTATVTEKERSSLVKDDVVEKEDDGPAMYLGDLSSPKK